MKTEDEKLFGIDKLNIKRSSIPAITHVDYSARIQTVHKETNPRYYELIKNLRKLLIAQFWLTLHLMSVENPLFAL